MKLTELVSRYDEELRTEAYAGVDASANGLQVGPDEDDVEHVAVAVDAAVATIEEAAGVGADVLVTHHGISWGGIERVTGSAYDRISALLDDDIALYVSHLPLDGHQELGNAAGLADVLELEAREPFATLGGEPIGQRGTMSEPQPVGAIRDRLDGLPQGNRETRLLPFGPDRMQDVDSTSGIHERLRYPLRSLRIGS